MDSTQESMSSTESSTPSTPTAFANEIDSMLARHERDLAQGLEALRGLSGSISGLCSHIIETIRSGSKVMFAGNGGSAAEAQHFSAELVGRFRRERMPYAGLALSTDTSILTAIGNDYSYDEVFSRQIIALGRPGDLLIVFSTSGESRNLIFAAEAARGRDIQVAAITGPKQNSLASIADLGIRVPGPDTATVQELHTVVVHTVCEIVERELSET